MNKKEIVAELDKLYSATSEATAKLTKIEASISMLMVHLGREYLDENLPSKIAMRALSEDQASTTPESQDDADTVKALNARIEQLKSKIAILRSSMELADSWWQCPRCFHYSKVGLICLNCRFDPTIPAEKS